MAMTPLTTPVPQTSDPVNFNQRADTLMTELPTFVTEANALQVDVNAKQVSAATSASNAATSETNAANSASAAQAASNATIWISGTTYVIGDCRFSPVDFRTYRRKTNGAGTTDPSSDSTNWQILTGVPYPFLHVREEQASGVSGGASISGTQIRTLNTVVFNSISGASLSSNLVTLPAGTYEVEISAPAVVSGSSKASFYNNTDVVTLLIGTSTSTSSNSAISTTSNICGRFTINSQKVFKINHYTSQANSVGLGINSSAPGLNEVYTEARFWKLA